MTTETVAKGAELFTLTSLGTFTGLTGATVVVTNTVSRITGWSPAWFGFLVALILCSAVPAITNGFSLGQQLLALLNACLVYLSAAGANAAGGAVTGNAPLPPPGAGERRGFFGRWF